MVLDVGEVVEQTARLAPLQLRGNRTFSLIDGGTHHQLVVAARIGSLQVDQFNILTNVNDQRVQVSAVVLHGGQIVVPHLGMDEVLRAFKADL